MARLLRALRYASLLVLTSSVWRRVVPAAAVFVLCDAYAHVAARLRLPEWRRARAFEEALFCKSALAGREDELATRHVAEQWKYHDTFWRPWLVTGAAIERLDVVHDQLAAGRRVLIVFPHFSMAYAVPANLHRFATPISVVAAPFHYTYRERNYYGLHARRGMAYIRASGEDLGMPRPETEDMPGTYEQCRARLLRGETVAIAFDSVGSLPTPFLGRTVPLASGPPRLALETDAVVVPVVTLRRGTKVVLRFGDPIDSRDHPDTASLQTAIAAVMERWVLQAPQTVWPLDTQPGGAPLIKDEPTAAPRAT